MNGIPILSTAYFPHLEYMATFVKNQSFRIERHETFPKQTYRNRCVIYTANGLQTLSVPVTKVEGNQTKDIKICYLKGQNWQQLHWRAITSAYSKSPYFDHYKHVIEPFFRNQYNLLIDLNDSILKKILELLKLDVEIKYTTHFEKWTTEKIDLRNAFSAKLKRDFSSFPPYYQVFTERFGFQPNLSILDLLFCEGPYTLKYLETIYPLMKDRQS